LLEPDARKRASPVLRGAGRSNAPGLPGHTARQVVYDVAVHGWTLHRQDLAWPPAVATDRPVALDPSGGGPRVTSIFSVTLSDARDRRRTLAEPPFGAATTAWMLIGSGAPIRSICASTSRRRDKRDRWFAFWWVPPYALHARS